jgi:hypothetical protein
MVDSLAVWTNARARSSDGPGEWRLEGASVRPAQRARAIEQIWRSVAAEPHPTAAPLLSVRFDDKDVVLADPLGDGTLLGISKQGERRGRRLPLPLLVSLRAALTAGNSALFHADFRGLRLDPSRLMDAVVLFGGEPRVRLSAFDSVDDGRLGAHDFSPRHLLRLFTDDHSVLPEAIAKLAQTLEQTRELEDACASIRSALVELVGSATVGARAHAVCAPFTPWGMSGTPARVRWEQRHENALVQLGATPLAERSRERRCRQHAAAQQIRARYGDAAAPSQDTAEMLLDRGVRTVRAQRLGGDLPSALGLCRELLRDFAHESEPWLVLAELGTQSGASTAMRLFACHEAITAARGRGAVVERACRVFGFHDPRELSRSFRANGSAALAEWLAAA